jgi:hypothetical protein
MLRGPSPWRSIYGTTIMNATFHAGVQCTRPGLTVSLSVHTANAFAGQPGPASGSAAVTPSVWEREYSADTVQER